MIQYGGNAAATLRTYFKPILHTLQGAVAGQLQREVGGTVSGCKASCRGLVKTKISATCNARSFGSANQNHRHRTPSNVLLSDWPLQYPFVDRRPATRLTNFATYNAWPCNLCMGSQFCSTAISWRAAELASALTAPLSRKVVPIFDPSMLTGLLQIRDTNFLNLRYYRRCEVLPTLHYEDRTERPRSAVLKQHSFFKALFCTLKRHTSVSSHWRSFNYRFMKEEKSDLGPAVWSCFKTIIKICFNS